MLLIFGWNWVAAKQSKVYPDGVPNAYQIYYFNKKQRKFNFNVRITYISSFLLRFLRWNIGVQYVQYAYTLNFFFIIYFPQKYSWNQQHNFQI